ncbi:HAMP domain-containing sensor histidine kinase [Amnibacterium sp.]|uniref:sensor histidine kinase n=1 Tax=Amnibacterium sp. TaxID=1872496 RepID=UPI0026280FD4|nr:HAMP domain-containing sensor histidine kinase [Amnibacterium sp.]MCU1472879.1 sensor histidine kinase [Amnibacterium sp.]
MLSSIQARVTLGSVAIAAIVLALLGVVVGEQLHRIAGTSIADLAKAELQPYIADLRNQPDEQPDVPNRGEQVLVIGPDGRTVVDTVPAGLLAAVRASSGDAARVHEGGVGYVAVAATVTNPRGTWRLWAVRSSVGADRTVSAVARVLLLTAPVLLLLVALGSWLLVRAALRPVRRLRTAADRISSAGTPGRLPEERGRDELAALTATLNRFLDAQQDGIERERRMVADASHELRTPLAVLTTRLDLAERHVGDADALAEAVRQARSDVAALSRLTTQLLELSQLGSPSVAAAQDGTVGGLLSETMVAVDRARALAGDEAHVEFEIGGDIDEAAWVRLDPLAFGRIVDNLTTNALRATSRGSVEVRIQQEHDRLVLTVSDTGTGVPADFLPRAFDRFTRAAERRAAGAEGSGLGLALVRALAHAGGGDVTLANRAGTGGAVATVTLPLTPPR